MCLDLETTGATPIQDRITEIGLIRYENGIEVGRWNTLISPEVSIPAADGNHLRNRRTLIGSI